MHATTNAEADDVLMTLGPIARQCGVTEAQARYAVNAYRIEPRGRIGILRYWHREDLDAIRSALRRIASRSGGQR